MFRLQQASIPERARRKDAHAEFVFDELLGYWFVSLFGASTIAQNMVPPLGAGDSRTWEVRHDSDMRVGITRGGKRP